MKKVLFVLAIGILFGTAGYAQSQKAFKKQKMNVVNLLGYSEIEQNTKIAKAIWNDNVKVYDLPPDDSNFGTFDTTKNTIINISTNPEMKNDIDYSLELATIISYFAYIKFNKGESNLEQKALEHARLTYAKIIENVTKQNANAKFTNPRNFKEMLESKMIEPTSNTVYIFSK